MAADIRWEEQEAGGRMEADAMEASLGLAHALFTGDLVAGPAVGALKRTLQGVFALRISLVDKTGQFLLHFPVVEAGEVVMGPLDAIAKCKEGTAAWTAFQTSRILSSQQPGMRGFDCLDWMQLKRYYHDCNIVTVPIDAPEGVLGALTGVTGPEKPEKKLVSELQSLAQHLARSLTFCKCKSELQTAVALLQRAGPPQEYGAAELKNCCEHLSALALRDEIRLIHAMDCLQTAVTLLQRGVPPGKCGSTVSDREPPEKVPDQAAACASPCSSRDSFSDIAEAISGPVPIQPRHQPSLTAKDFSSALIPPAQRYSEWLSANLHGQDQHTLASLSRPGYMPPLRHLRPKPATGMIGGGCDAESAQSCCKKSRTHQNAPDSGDNSGSCTATGCKDTAGKGTGSPVGHLEALGEHSKLNSLGCDSCATGTCSGSTQAKDAQSQRPQQSVTAQSCCAGQPCGQWDALWALENFGADAKILGNDMQTLNSDAQRLSMDAFGQESDAVSVSGSEQISDYEPIGQRNRSSLSSEESDSRSSLGSTRDWQGDGNGSPAPTSERIPSLDASENPDEQHMLRLCCGEPGCATSVWLRPDQLGLEAVDLQRVHLQAVDLQSVDLQQVDLQHVELAPVSLEQLHGQQPAQAGSWAAPARVGLPNAAQQTAGSRAAQRASAPTAPTLDDRLLGTPAATSHDSAPDSTSTRRASDRQQERHLHPRQPLLLEQEWDLTFSSHRLERRFTRRFNRHLGQADVAHCALLLLTALFHVAYGLLLDSHHVSAASLIASCFVAFVAAAQLILLLGIPAALQCRDQMASIERLIMPALSLFLCLSQASAQSEGFPHAYLSGWLILTHLAVARRLRLRLHLLLVMPELCMQATACMAGSLCRQDSLQQALSGFLGAQTLAAVLLPTTAVYILEQQARWRFLLGEIKGKA